MEEQVKINIIIQDQGSQTAEAVSKQLSGIDKAGELAKKSLNGIATSMKAAGTVFASTAAAAMLVRKAIDFGAEGAQMIRLRASSDQLAEGFNQSMGAIVAAIKQASGGAINEFEAMEAANRAMLLGVAKTPAQFAQLTKSAVALGRAMGRTAVESINDISTGIGRMSPLILDNLAVMTNGGKVYDDYAKKLGTTSDKLTEAEKKQALFNVTVKSAAPLLNEQGDLILDLASNYEQFDVAVSEAMANIKQSSAESIGEAATGLTVLLNLFNAHSENTRLLDEHGVSLDDVREKYGFWTGNAVVLTAAVAAEAQEITKLTTSVERSDSALIAMANAHSAAAGAAAENEASTISLKGAMADFALSAMASQIQTKAWTEVTADGFISNAEIFKIQNLSSLMGVELPADIGEAARVFNTLSTEGLDPATASSQQLFDALFKLDGMEIDIHFKTHGAIPGVGNIDLGGGFSAGGGGSIQEQASVGGGLSQFHEGGILPAGGVSLVGERGPELVIGNRVFDTATTIALLSSGILGNVAKFGVVIDEGGGSTGGVDPNDTGGALGLGGFIPPVVSSGSTTTQASTQAVATSTQATQEAIASVEKTIAPALAAVAVAMPTSQDISSGIVEAQLSQTREQMRQAQALLAVNQQMLEVMSEQGTSADVGRAVRDSIQSIT